MSKYPKTPHLPFSPCVADDDEVLTQNAALSRFVGRDIVITEKLDGGNCCLASGEVFARTHSSPASHPSFGPIRELYSCFSYMVDDNIKLFGENMYGIHSIEYDKLSSFFYLFGVLEDNTNWLSWDQVLEHAAKYEIPTVPLLFEGNFSSLDAIKTWMDARLTQPSACGTTTPEGFVIRLRQGFSNDQFEQSIAKYVRKDHIQTDESWRRTWKAAKLASL